MKFKINDYAYSIYSLYGKIGIEKMMIDEIKKERYTGEIYYSGEDITDRDNGRIFRHEKILFTSYQQAIEEIEKQLKELKTKE